MNGGSISDDARERYFGFLKPRHDDNTKVIDGKALVVLDRWAVINREQVIGEALAGVRAEIIMNRNRMSKLKGMCEDILRDPDLPIPYDRFRDEAASSYLARPVASGYIPYEALGAYSDQARVMNRVIDGCAGLSTVECKRGAAQSVLGVIQQFDTWSVQVQGAVEKSPR